MQTDKCHICESGKKVKAAFDSKVIPLINEAHKNCKNCSRDKFCSAEDTFPDKLKLQKARQLYQEPLQLWEEHVFSNKHQQEQFKLQQESLKSGDAILVVDYKENISMGESLIQLGQDFYNRPQRAFFGGVLLYKEQDTIKKHHFDIMSVRGQFRQEGWRRKTHFTLHVVQSSKIRSTT